MPNPIVRKDQKERAQARLETLVLEGLASGDPIPFNADYRKNLRQDLAARRRAKKASAPYCSPSGAS